MRTTAASFLVVTAVLGAGSIITAQHSPDLTKINPKFLMTVEDAQKLHAAKDSLGPALSGNASWRNFVGIIETRLRAANAVGFVKNAWTFNRWSTSEFPDTSGWSLSSDGKPIKVASYGANSGTTLPDGVTADMVFVDLGVPWRRRVTREDRHRRQDRRLPNRARDREDAACRAHLRISRRLHVPVDSGDLPGATRPDEGHAHRHDAVGDAPAFAADPHG